MVTALWIAFWLVVIALVWREYTRPVVPVAVKEPNALQRLFSFKPDAEAPKDYPTQTMPRRAGSWRAQRRTLEKAHNTKQKHLDALTNYQSKEPNHAATR